MRSLIVIAFLICLFSNPLIFQAAASPSAAVVSNHSGYLDITSIPDTYHVVGEVSNTGTVSVTSVNVTATFVDFQNDFLGQASSFTMLIVLAPLQKSPFEVVLIANADQVSNYTLSLSFEEFQGSQAPFLEITNVSRTISIDGFTHVTGSITNRGPQNATHTKVAGTFYDAGLVIATAYEYCIPSTIEPASTAIFEIIPVRKITGNANFTLTAESQQYSVVPELSTSMIIAMIAAFALSIGLSDSKKRKVTRRNRTTLEKG